MVRNFLKKIKNLLIGDYAPDIALRYLPVMDILKTESLSAGRILEVGSGDLGITPYLKKNITGLDIEFGEEISPLVKRVKYAGGLFPFADNEFDLVISVDSLEHIRPEDRPAALNEALRVAGQTFIIVVPSGEAAYRHDQELAAYYERVRGGNGKFFDEHLRNGLPEAIRVEKMLEASAVAVGKNIKIKSDRLLNIKIRKFYMKCAINPGILPSILYYSFLLLLPFRGLFNFGQCYRRLFYVSIE